MKQHTRFLARTPLLGFSLIFALTVFLSTSIHACTIFVLTDADRALFFNNEDWSNPVTRIWFVPAGDDYYGCAYVGFDNGWAQGGVNSEGLAFDWVAGYTEKWEPIPGLKNTRGNPSNRMLETCATVEDAVAFYQKHWEPSFSYAKILIADRSGASVIIGSKEGKLQVERSNQSRGFGYGGQILNKMLAAHPKISLTSGFEILQACSQEGQYATKYSNIFDLKSGDIYVYPWPEKDENVKINLAEELKKGAHYYDIPKVHDQLTLAPQPLLDNMKRFPIDEYKPIPDPEPQITEHLRTVMENAMEGVLQEHDYTPELWQDISLQQEEIQAELSELGDFVSITLVKRKKDENQCRLWYRMEFKNYTVVQLYILDEQNKIAYSQSVGIEPKVSEIE